MSQIKRYFPNLQDAIIQGNATIRDALDTISKSGALMACYTDSSGKLEGILTDSDIRRALLKGAGLTEAASKWIKRNPISAPANATSRELLDLTGARHVREIPLLDESGCLVDIFVLVHFEEQLDADNPAINQVAAPRLTNSMFILAGGLGSRLKSVVHDRPKPMALVGNKPILETIIKRANIAGISKFYISVNYMSEVIEEHLQNKQFADLEITILKEPKKLGTAGSLKMIAGKVHEPFMVCNADILTTAPYERIIAQHQAQESHLTCCVRPYSVRVPFGVADISGDQITKIKEKPENQYFVNAGIYVLAPKILEMIGELECIDMPDLITRVIASGGKVSPFLMHEYWIDIGRPEEFQKANDEFENIFK